MKRLDRAGAYETLITRDDGVVYLLRGVGDSFAIPHDLAHYVVEKALGLQGGFWGTIADGAVFGTMHYHHGRRAPKAAARSRARLTANAAALEEAEGLVRCYAGLGEPLQSARSTRGVSPAQQDAVTAAYVAALSQWRVTDVDNTLLLQWG